jgi:hypothetical protein
MIAFSNAYGPQRMISDKPPQRQQEIGRFIFCSIVRGLGVVNSLSRFPCGLRPNLPNLLSSSRSGSKMPKQTRGGYCPCRKSCSGGRSASQKKLKREVRHAKQGSDRPDVAAAPPASAEPASATIIWIVTSRKISGVVLMKMLPFADSKCLRTLRLPKAASVPCST